MLCVLVHACVRSISITKMTDVHKTSYEYYATVGKPNVVIKI